MLNAIDGPIICYFFQELIKSRTKLKVPFILPLCYLLSQLTDTLSKLKGFIGRHCLFNAPTIALKAGCWNDFITLDDKKVITIDATLSVFKRSPYKYSYLASFWYDAV